MKKVLTMFLALLLCFGLTACGGSDNDTSKEDKKDKVEKKDEEKKALEIADSGYSMAKDYLVYGVAVKNPNNEYSIEFPTYVVTAYAEDGSVIATEDQVLNLISPQETIYWAGQVDCKGQTPAKVEFTTKKSDKKFTKDKKTINSTLSIENPNEVVGDYNTTYTGIVKNDHSKDLESVAIILILKNDEKIVGGQSTFVDDIPSKQTAPFEINSYHDVPHNSFEIFTYDWS